ncbi:MAG: hypothetical protein WBF23_00870, partial [Methyloceanibacter sp.]
AVAARKIARIVLLLIFFWEVSFALIQTCPVNPASMRLIGATMGSIEAGFATFRPSFADHEPEPVIWRMTRMIVKAGVVYAIQLSLSLARLVF